MYLDTSVHRKKCLIPHQFKSERKQNLGKQFFIVSKSHKTYKRSNIETESLFFSSL